VGASRQPARDVGCGLHVVYALVHYPPMDLTLSPSEQAFRDELRSWLAENHPGDDPPGEDAAFDHRRAWQRQLYDAGYAGFSWPKEYGGRGATLVEQAIFSEEMARVRAPAPANVLGMVMGGPVVIHHGTDEQKERFLRPILTGDEIWCQGFSEPESGSDLASLKTKAVKSNGEWVVTGQKVWTTFAHKSKWCMLVARTDPDAPKHQGLTYFILDMEQEAVQVRPLHQITNEPEFNELFIEEARIPDENVVGGVGNGWTVAITTLMNERAGLGAGAAASMRIALEDLKELARDRGLADDPVIRQRIAQLQVEVELLRLNSWRGLTQIMKRGVPGPEGSLPKWQWGEIHQALTELAAEILGEDAAEWDNPWTYRLLRSRANSIEGGTTEILKNIIAERVLGLPKLR
jgi:alkylation response protein AidB-like acyl-CoA dehydrogenase